MPTTMYEEDRVLADYVCRQYGGFMTEFEGRVAMSFHVASKQELLGDDSPEKAKLQAFLSEKPEVVAAMAEGVVSFQAKVAKRILSQHSSQIHIHRCPMCACILRTPRARQCLWCGHSWHHMA